MILVSVKYQMDKLKPSQLLELLFIYLILVCCILILEVLRAWLQMLGSVHY